MHRIVLVALGVVLLSGCGGSAGHPSVLVSPRWSVEDSPLSIRVQDLAPGERVMLRLRSTDAHGVTWTSSASFVADRNGVVDTSRAATHGGSYVGAWGTGLIVTMRPGGRSSGLYFWRQDSNTFVLQAFGTHGRLASTRFERSWSRTPLHEMDETVAEVGFYGSFFAPRGTRTRPALLLFGGSEGGLSTWLLAARFAADGIPTFALAYFDEPGLPQALKDIPLEYFAHALRWLERRPEVDPTRVAVAGISRGSEAAQLLAVHYPDLVHGALALVPSDVPVCGIVRSNVPGCIGAPWTLNGKPLPYTHQFDNPYPTDAPVIPDERIRGPVLLVCGRADAIWTSCPYAEAIIARLHAHHFAFSDALYAYPRAGHFVGSLLPYEPGQISYDSAVPGDEQAREQLWPHVLAFVRDLPR